MEKEGAQSSNLYQSVLLIMSVHLSCCELQLIVVEKISYRISLLTCGPIIYLPAEHSSIFHLQGYIEA